MNAKEEKQSLATMLVLTLLAGFSLLRLSPVPASADDAGYCYSQCNWNQGGGIQSACMGFLESGACESIEYDICVTNCCWELTTSSCEGPAGEGFAECYFGAMAICS